LIKADSKLKLKTTAINVRISNYADGLKGSPNIALSSPVPWLLVILPLNAAGGHNMLDVG